MAAALCMLLVGAASATPSDDVWYQQTAEGGRQIEFYFFWSRYCPHCLEARPLVEQLAREYSWLRVHSGELTTSEQAVSAYRRLAGMLGQEANAVPAFLFCGQMIVGFESAATTGAYLRELLQRCRDRAPPPPARLAVPVLGELDPAVSLPLTTVVLAGLDAFNPCAFFVLLFLLSLMVHARSRARMLLVGGVFVLCSGLVYFVFMTAWLNVFLIAGELRAVTRIAGVIAVAIAFLNIKDYFRFKRGVALGISQSAQPRLFARMRALLGAERLPAVLAGTVVLAVAANTYELFCTAGFPMVFTRLLTLRDLPIGAYYGYLALYNLVYVLPLAVIVAVFAWTLGARKLSEQEGRLLKLLSGVMMLGLGGALLIAPHWLNHPLTALVLLAVALLVTFGASRRRPEGRR
jgi:thiol-disulfide isomerase/thioredoxin